MIYRYIYHLSCIFTGITGDVFFGEPWGPCPMTMVKGRKQYCGSVCHGHARILQCPTSDVSMNIPAGAIGVYVMGVHTNFSFFKTMLDVQECFVSPLVEIECKNTDTESETKHQNVYIVKVPHCLKQKSLLDLIRVRQIKRSLQIHEILPQGDSLSADHYSVDKNFITICVKHFSEFVCTTCQTTCQATVKSFLFANLGVWKRNNVSMV